MLMPETGHHLLPCSRYGHCTPKNADSIECVLYAPFRCNRHNIPLHIYTAINPKLQVTIQVRSPGVVGLRSSRMSAPLQVAFLVAAAQISRKGPAEGVDFPRNRLAGEIRYCDS